MYVQVTACKLVAWWHQAITWTINNILGHSFQGNIYLNIQDINPQVMFDMMDTT